MVLLQRFESKVYKNGCNALTTVCNASHSYVILVHTMHFALEQKQINETRKSHVTTLEKYGNRLFPFHIVGGQRHCPSAQVNRTI